MKVKKQIGLEKIIIILLSGMLVATIATGVYFAIEKNKVNKKIECECNCKEKNVLQQKY